MTYFMDHEEADASDDAASAAAEAMSDSPHTFTLDGWGTAGRGPLLSLGYRQLPALPLASHRFRQLFLCNATSQSARR